MMPHMRHGSVLRGSRKLQPQALARMEWFTKLGCEIADAMNKRQIRHIEMYHRILMEIVIGISQIQSIEKLCSPS